MSARARIFVAFVGGATVVALGCSSDSNRASGAVGRGGGGGGTGVAGSGVAGTGVAGSGGGGTGVAGSGVAGTAGRAGASGAPGTGGTMVDVGLGFHDTSASVLTRNKHETRDGSYIEPTFKLDDVAARMRGDTAFAVKFSGGLMGSPLYMEDGPAGKGAFFVATTSNDVYALDETTGAVLWQQSIGSAPLMTGVGCGNVTPVGIISTPVIDAASRTIFVAGAVGDGVIVRHEVHALNVDTGVERLGWPVDVSALTAPGPIAFNAPAQNQRGALSLVNGILYVPYGGHAGDCSQYRGWVVAIKIADPTQTAAWATAGMGEGIWAPGGMASTGDGVLAITGNNTGGGVDHLDSEEVVHIRGMAQVDRMTGIFFPGSWHDMDLADQDFGSSNAVVFSLPGATPSILMAAVSKNGLFFLLDPAHLGGMDGYLAQLTIADGPVKATPIAYRTALATYVLVSAVNAYPFCPPGSAVSPNTVYSVAIAITPGSPPTAKVAWCGVGSLPQSIVTTTDGTHDAIVWLNNGGVLYGMDGDGAGIFVAVSDLICPSPGMASPIAVKGRIVQGSNDGRLCSYSLH
jgi:outer membrane protein assembly factor BamB